MTEAEIILLMVKCIPILLAVFIFLHLLCDEYVRALERLGVLGRRTCDVRPQDRAPGGRAGGPAEKLRRTSRAKPPRPPT